MSEPDIGPDQIRDFLLAEARRQAQIGPVFFQNFAGLGVKRDQAGFATQARPRQHVGKPATGSADGCIRHRRTRGIGAQDVTATRSRWRKGRPGRCTRDHRCCHRGKHTGQQTSTA